MSNPNVKSALFSAFIPFFARTTCIVSGVAVLPDSVEFQLEVVPCDQSLLYAPLFRQFSWKTIPNLFVDVDSGWAESDVVRIVFW